MGSNACGQLGDGSFTDSSIPVATLGLTNVVAIAVGRRHMLAVEGDGSAWAWGRNDSGELADRTPGSACVPFRISALTGIRSVAAGDSHSVALGTDGTVWAWGNNWFNQLGQGSDSAFNSTPVRIPGLSGIVAVTAGGDHSAALTTSGGVWCWGSNACGQLGDGTWTRRDTPVRASSLSDIRSISAGGDYTVALNGDGTIYAWGSVADGQLGEAPPTSDVYLPSQVPDLTGFTSISVAYQHTIALREDGTVWAWGDNSYGQLGVRTTRRQAGPVKVYGLSNVTAIAAAGYHSAALKSDGTVWTWGRTVLSEYGVTCTETDSPSETGLSGITAIAAGGNHTVAVQNDGRIWTWGNNDSGQIGDGTTSRRPDPVKLAYFATAKAVAAGNTHTLVLSTEGQLWAWGSNVYGQLGDSTKSSKLSPTQTSGAWAAVSAGQYHSLALDASGSVWTWGWNGYAQLGNGSFVGGLTPGRLTGYPTVPAVAIAAGYRHSVALEQDGMVSTWGDNAVGQLGIGQSGTKTVPTRVLGLPAARAIAAGGFNTAAVASDGTVWAWGSDGYYGQVDGGRRKTKPVPFLVVGFGLTQPVGRVVIDGGAPYTTNTQVTLSLTASDEAGVVTGMLIGESDTASGQWEPFASTKTWPLRQGTGATTLCVRFRSSTGAISDRVTASITRAIQRTTASAKTCQQYPDEKIVITGQVVTAKFGDCIYVESPDRTAGIRVSPAPASVNVGDLVYVVGVVSVTNNEVTISQELCGVIGSGVVQPLAIPLTSVGGGSFGLQKGLMGWYTWRYDETEPWQRVLGYQVGLNNVGLLVKTFGKVIDQEPTTPPAAPTWFKINDGLDTNVKVVVPPDVTVPPVGGFVTVTGISSCQKPGTDLLPQIRVRQQSDITPR